MGNATKEQLVKAETALKSKMLRHLNVLARKLRSANTDKGLYYRGRTLAGGRHLINTFKAVQSNRDNDDRFRVISVDPKVSAGISIAIDCSGSMDSACPAWGGIGRHSRWENIAILLNGILPALDRIGVKTYAGLVDVIGTDNQMGYKGSVFEITNPNQKWRTENYKKLYDLYMSGGTHIATYALTAIEMAEELPTSQKIALFITDGYCGSLRYLESLRQQALAKGITLIGVGIGDVDVQTAQSFPNGIYARNGLVLGEHLLSHLAKVVERGEVEASVIN
jgi:hypothetical protein